MNTSSETVGPGDRFVASVPGVSVNYAATGTSTQNNALGMRPMQERVWQHRGEQYLLIKSPPASGKSRALMFVALDKIHNQGLKQAIIVVPERTIGASFQSTALSEHGFWADWVVEPQWNLCDRPGGEGRGTVAAFGDFLESDAQILVCTHATFRFAVEKYGIEALDDRLIAIDEFHHVSADVDNNVLGAQLTELIERDKAHMVAMTGSYFRGDTVPVLSPEDEAKFSTVTYTYYEQLSGYRYLKHLDIGYFFYGGSYLDDVMKVLNPYEKTILHIPNVNSRESTQEKIREVEEILEGLGTWKGVDPETGFQLVETEEGKILRIADLVDDEPRRRDKVAQALRNPAVNEDRDWVDIIIALGMAKEGFDWIWCEHALTVGYRASLTEVVQIIGRATRDAPSKERARFTNLIAEPDVSQDKVAQAINDTLKAIAASLLMEQVLAPRWELRPKYPDNTATEGFDYGDSGYDPDKNNVGVDRDRGTVQVEIAGLRMPNATEAQRICREDLNDLVASFVQDGRSVERGMFDEELVPEELTQVRMGKIIQDRYPNLDDADQEAVRQHAIAALNLTQEAARQNRLAGQTDSGVPAGNTALIDGVRRFALNVKHLNMDLIDRINPFSEAYAILSKSMTEERLKEIAAIITARNSRLTPQEAREMAERAVQFKNDRGRLPVVTSTDPWERMLAEGAAKYMQYVTEGRYEVTG